MSEQANYLTPQAMSKELEVSSATLRRWSQRFSDYLSAEATGSDEGRSHRRYTEDDLITLRLVKELMNNGMTYEQVHQQLTDQFTISREQPSSALPESPDDFDDDDSFLADEELTEERGLITSNGNESAAVAFLTNTLATLSESQKSILNSQAANRELMGVLIQDNFNLKEENNRLRERILEVERNLAQSRQENDWQRETLRQELDAKISMAQQIATEAMTTAQSTPAPDIRAVKANKPGCLGALFGARGDVQIVSIPQRRERRADGRPMSIPSPAPRSSSQQTSRPHPRPTAPPE